MTAGLFAGYGSVYAAEEGNITGHSVLSEVELDSDNPDYNALYNAELYNYKVIRNLETAYDSEDFTNYCNTANILLMMDPENLGENEQAAIWNIYETRNALETSKTLEDCMLFIWGDTMPTEEDEESLEFTISSYDNADFRPYLVPYLLEDPSQAVGNVIMVSGGGFESRTNDSEGFPTAHVFNEMGYNVFLLQRRVAPYGTNDIFADLQRALRYVRFNKESLNLGGTDKMIAVGWSGGAATVIGTVALFYGDVQPTTIDPDYVPDEIDAENGDFDVVVPVYGASYDFREDYTGLETENENLPAFFISMGADDPVVKISDTVALFNSVRDKTEAELHIFSQNAHGYGPGLHNTNSQYWPMLADQFIQQAVTMKNDDTAEVCKNVQFGKIPGKYTKMQSFTGYAGFGTTDVTVAVNDDESAYFIFYEAFGMEVVVAGLVDEGYTNNRYDRVGQFAASAQYIYDGVDKDAWEEIPVEYRE